MRILFVIPNIESFRLFLTDLSTALVDRGHEVHLACSQQKLWASDARPLSAPVRVHPIPFARGMNLVGHAVGTWRLSRLVSEIRPDIVHAHLTSGIFVTALARRRNWPVTIGTFQGVNFLLSRGPKARLVQAAEVLAASRMDRVWVLTEDDLAGLRRAAPRADVTQQVACGFGCDLQRFDPDSVSPEARAALRAELDIPQTATVFSFVGRFVAFKGFDVTVRAFLQLCQRRPEVRLLLIGTRDALHPTGLTPEEERALRNCPQIIELGWRSDVEKYLAITQAVVFPSQREGMPVCLMEALAMGVPVITRDARGCRDVVRHETDGLVLADCSTESLAAALESLALDPARRQQLADNALRGRGRFARAHYIDEQTQIYDELLAGVVPPLESLAAPH